MRASGGTNFGLALSVVACTNATIACLAGPSFHDGKGSPCANACAPTSSAARSANRPWKRCSRPAVELISTPFWLTIHAPDRRRKLLRPPAEEYLHDVVPPDHADGLLIARRVSVPRRNAAAILLR